MMLKPIFLTGIVTVLLLLSACGSNQKQQQQKGVFIGGTQGVTGNFEAFGVQENNVYTIFDTETFPLEVTLRNKGEYDLKAGDVSVTLQGPSTSEISGVQISNSQFTPLKNKGTVEKISDLNPTGGEETINFASDAKYLSPVVGAIQRQWFANIEYFYETYAIIPEVCLKEDLKDKRVCEVKEKKNFFVSSAPITVTNVEQETAGQGIMAIKIKIKNAGVGKVAKPSEDFGINDQLIYSLDDPAWECKSTGKISEARLNKGEADIICKLKQPLSKATLSTKQIKLTLQYKYRDIIQEKLQIKQSIK